MTHHPLLTGYRQQLENDASKAAFILDGQAYTYADLAVRVAHLQQAFAEHKHKHRHLRVAIALPNCVDVACWYIACVKSRHTLILMDPEWPQVTMQAALELVQPDIIVSGNIDSVGEVVHRCLQAAGNPGWYSKSDFAFLAGFTSGSTGQPKAFLRYSDSWLASFACSAREFDVSSDTVQLAPGPLSHGLSFYAMAESLHAGATFVTQTVFNAARCIRLLQTTAQSSAHTVINLVVVPTMLQRILDASVGLDSTQTARPAQQQGGGLATLKFRAIVAGAKLSVRLKQYFHKTWPTARLSEYYGASELSFVSVNHDVEQLPHDSVGRLCEGVTIANFDDQGKYIEGEKPGTLHVRSLMLASGYLQRQRAGLVTVPLKGHAGWCTVGDRGWLDVKGNLYLSDREDRMLISGGLNVYPSSVERVISDALHNSEFAADVEHCAVCGKPDQEWGEQVVLVLAGAGLPQRLTVATARIKQHLADCYSGSLQKHEVPRRLYIAETLPMTSSGKVAYRELQQLLPCLLELQI